MPMNERELKQPHSENIPQEASGNKWVKYLKNLGIAGFLFFLIKGLVWIAVFSFGVKGCSILTQ